MAALGGALMPGVDFEGFTEEVVLDRRTPRREDRSGGKQSAEGALEAEAQCIPEDFFSPVMDVVVVRLVAKAGNV